MLTVIYAIIIFCLLIFPHELGHFTAARLTGVKVNELALGMGPTLWSKQGQETKYSLRAIPVGGFCAMEGEDEGSDDPRAFNNKGGWSKLFILAAGSLVNVLIAIVIMIGISMAMGTVTTTLAEVTDGGPAQQAGIEAGDKIVQIDNTKVDKWDDVSKAISNASANRKMEITVERDGEKSTYGVVPEKGQDGNYVIGIRAGTERNVLKAFPGGVKATWDMTVNMFSVLKQLFTGKVGINELSGPVGIIYVVNETAHMGIVYVAYITALISLNLAIMNMLPFPALDGGRILFLVIRKITGKAVSDEVEGKIHIAGLIILFLLMIYVTFNDVIKYIIPVFS